jgi:hypothetical protein
MDYSPYLDFVDRWHGLRADELQGLADRAGVKAVIIPVNAESSTERFGQYVLGQLKNGTSAVLLLDLHDTNTRSEPGGHYVALVPRNNGEQLEFFDPAGKSPDTYPMPSWVCDLTDYFEEGVWQPDRTQPPHSTSCGPWCLIRIMLSHLCRRSFIQNVLAVRRFSD